MTHDLQWRELYRTDDADVASMVATCLEAMEFQVRFTAKKPTVSTHHLPPPRSTYHIDVPARDWGDLNEVLPELISEQTFFDDVLKSWPARAARWERWLLGVAIFSVILLSMLGLIDL